MLSGSRSTSASPPSERATIPFTVKRFAVPATLLALVVLTACAAGGERFSVDTPAGFWLGLWHGAISCITLIIGIFTDAVDVYEVSNTGGWYDFGFLFGATAIWGGGSSGYHARRERARRNEEWTELANKIEAKLKRKIRQWADADPDDDWDVVEALAENKLKNRVREWANED